MSNSDSHSKDGIARNSGSHSKEGIAPTRIPPTLTLKGASHYVSNSDSHSKDGITRAHVVIAYNRAGPPGFSL